MGRGAQERRASSLEKTLRVWGDDENSCKAAKSQVWEVTAILRMRLIVASIGTNALTAYMTMPTTTRTTTKVNSYECDSCGAHRVYGLEELLAMNFIVTETERTVCR